MAKAVITHITDDIDGSTGAESHTVAIDGKTYQIDLAPKNWERIMKGLAPIVEYGQPVRNGSTNGAHRKSSAKAQRSYDIKQLREWAGKNKIAVPSRGRIPGAVVEQYQAAGGH
jgi:hypothetical protein